MAYSFATNKYLQTNSANITAQPITIFCRCYSNTAHIGAGFAAGKSAANLVYVLTVRNSTPTGAGLVNWDGSIFSSSLLAYSNSQWLSIAALLISNTSRTGYLNGSAATTDTVNKSFSTLDRLTIGASSFSATTDTFLNGFSCDCAIWDAELTSAEMVSLSKGFKPSRVRPQSLVFYSPLVRELQDIVGGLTLTNTNSATVANHPRVY